MSETETLQEKVQAAINEVRPGLQADGGDVELVRIQDDGVVVVKLQGACSGCPMAQLTLKGGVEKVIRERVPEIKAVEAEGLTI